MKFYEVKNGYGNYPAVIWANGPKEAMEIYRCDVVYAAYTTATEIDIDKLYKEMIEVDENSMITQLPTDEVMRRLQAVISSTVPVVVLTRVVD